MFWLFLSITAILACLALRTKVFTDYFVLRAWLFCLSMAIVAFVTESLWSDK